MIDIHSHILPAIDDGAIDMNMSLGMLELAKASGTKVIFATPHYKRGRWEREYSEIIKACNTLGEISRDIRVLPGQEVFLDRYTLDDFDRGIAGTLNGTRYMLVELPYAEVDREEFDILYELRIKGIIPILAHPERYKYIVEKPSNINSFIEEGILFQLNLSSLEGAFGKEVKTVAEKLLEHNVYDFVGSDAHNSGKRSTNLTQGLDILRRKAGIIYNKIEQSSEKLLINEVIKPSAQRLGERRKIFDFLKRK